MDRSPKFPPVFQPVRCLAPDAFDAAVRAAQSGAGAATLFWAERADAIDCAIVLEPDGDAKRPLLAAYAAMVAIGDALGGILPEQAPVAFEWPDRVLVNDGCIGGLQVAAAPTADPAAAPAWIVVGLLLAIEPDPEDEPGRHPEVTTLGDEFAYGEDFSPADLLESYASHFLYWIDRWQNEGFAPVRRAWLERALGHHEKEIGRRHFFRVEAIDDDGTATLRRDNVRRILTIEQGIKARSWWLPDRFGAYRAEIAALRGG